ncbi:hypothetical protein ACWCPI_04960 [Streptomyces sp. NPDC001920]
MSGHRETNHGMSKHDTTHTDIAFLLAEAADEVEVGIAPYDAVLRGGRRRRARRWAVATATALALVGSATTLAVAGMPGGDGDRSRGSSVATSPPTSPPATPAPDVRTPQRTLLATGTERGKDWRVDIDVWEAPRDEREAQAELAAMAEFGDTPSDVRQASDLIGRSSYSVKWSYGTVVSSPTLIEEAFTAQDAMSGKDIQTAAVALEPGSEGPKRLVIGKVAVTAQQVTCTWKDGTTTEVPVVSRAHDVNSDDFVIRPVDGSPVNWFVCLAPEGTVYESVRVTQ